MSRSLRNFQRRPLSAAILATGLILPTLALAQMSPAVPAAAPQSTQAAPAAVAPSTPAAMAPPTVAGNPAAPLAAPLAPPAPDVALKLPRDLSPWGMFMAADIVVKAVMVGLVIVSVLTWTIWFAKTIELVAARHRLRAAIDVLGAARRWSDVTARAPSGNDSAAAMVRAAAAELLLSGDAMSAAGVKERIASRLERLEAAAGRRMIRGTGMLASIGATAPFVGLFGTVWGIMNSFIGISKAHSTNLAVVAPGIAEALLATALGLVAAIPAVMMYNMFARWIAGYRALHADTSAEILRIVSRDLDRGAFEHRPAERRRTMMAAE